MTNLLVIYIYICHTYFCILVTFIVSGYMTYILLGLFWVRTWDGTVEVITLQPRYVERGIKPTGYI